MVKAVLFDVDGVVCVPPELFSLRYARDNGINATDITAFFTGPFFQSTIGKADLKDLIIEHNHIWKWSGPIDELLDHWFTTEHIVSKPVTEYIQQLRAQGIKCYTATNQERYRAAYIRDTMFPDMFDGYFASCDLGVAKPSPKFFDAILEQLRTDGIIASPHDVAFFDDSKANVEIATSLGLNAYFVASSDDVLKKDLTKT